jgi:predicted RNA-binding protein with TRAM domain
VKKESAASALEEGSVYDVRIEAVGKRGDGIAKVGKYSLCVPGARKGDTVKHSRIHRKSTGLSRCRDGHETLHSRKAQPATSGDFSLHQVPRRAGSIE